MINISALQESVTRFPTILGKTIRQESTLRYFNVHTGAHIGKYLFTWVDVVPNWQPCCNTDDGEDNTGEKEVPVACILNRNTYCEEDLDKIFQDLRFTAGLENGGSAEQLLTEQHVSAQINALNKAIWQSDVTLDPSIPANKTLVFFDGLLKQATNDPDVVKVPITSGNIYQAIQTIITAIPADAGNGSLIYMFVDPAVYKLLAMSLVNMNYVHYTPPTVGTGYDQDRYLEMPGIDGVRIISAPGLAGTNQVFVSPAANLHWLTNLESDYTTISWKYFEWHERYLWRMKFLFGITYGLGEYVVLATLDPSVIQAGVGMPVVITNNPLNVGITSPLNAAGTAVQTQELP